MYDQVAFHVGDAEFIFDCPVGRIPNDVLDTLYAHNAWPRQGMEGITTVSHGVAKDMGILIMLNAKTKEGEQRRVANSIGALLHVAGCEQVTVAIAVYPAHEGLMLMEAALNRMEARKASLAFDMLRPKAVVTESMKESYQRAERHCYRLQSKIEKERLNHVA